MNKKQGLDGTIPDDNKGSVTAVAQQEILDDNSSPVEDIAMFVKRLSLTYSTFALYSSDHPVTLAHIKAAWDELLPVIEKYGNIDISFAEGAFYFTGRKELKLQICSTD